MCDIDPERTDATKEDFPDVRTYNRGEDILVDELVDLIANALPDNLQCSITVESLKTGRHLFVEKAMCITIVVATETISTAMGNDRRLYAHHNRRWDADFRTLREMV